jgi:phage-related protein
VEAKPVIWIASSYEDLCALPEEVQDDLGYALYQSQIGETSKKAKQMHGALREATEIVTDDAAGTYRLMYTVRLGDMVYVLHAFQKKSKHGIATPKSDLDLIERRLRIARMKHENRNH